jgi:hypothetical protein
MSPSSKFEFPQLTPDVRKLMLDELQYDLDHGAAYINPRLTEDAQPRYLKLLVSTLTSGDPDSFAAGIAEHGLMLETEIRNTGHGISEAHVPASFKLTLAEAEFNRYYMRALARMAIEQGKKEIEIVRSRESANPRPESQERVGKRITANELLDDLRLTNFERESVFGLASPNSGLSVRIPE